MDMTWDTLMELASSEREPLASLERQASRLATDPDVAVRLAHAAIREGKLVEALAHYDRAELLGADGAAVHAERGLVAQRVGDFPDAYSRLA